MRKLIDRIEDNANAKNPAADRMLGLNPVIGNTVQLECDKLNDSQLNALKSALGFNLTVIWGPPGTGKTHTIGTIAEYLNKDSRSVLIVSHTNTAVDQAIKHVANSMKEQLPGGAVVRVGEVKDEVLRSDFPDVLIKNQVERQSRDLVEQRNEFIKKRQSFFDEIMSAQKIIAIIDWLKSASDEIESLESAISDIDNLKEEGMQAEAELLYLKARHPKLLEIHELTGRILALGKLLLSKEEQKSEMEREFKAISEERQAILERIKTYDERIEVRYCQMLCTG